MEGWWYKNTYFATKKLQHNGKYKFTIYNAIALIVYFYTKKKKIAYSYNMFCFKC